MMTPEMKEALSYLSAQKDYALFAGFAAFLHTGIECSADIDVLVPSKAVVSRYQKNLAKQGWRVLSHKQGRYYRHIAFGKDKTTFDVGYTASSKPFFDTAIKTKWSGFTLRVISKEALLLTKMNQLAATDRSENKALRDRKVIHKLRKEINLKRLRSLVPKLHDTYWTKGWA